MALSAYEKVKTWRAKNKEKVNAQARRYRAKHPDKFKEIKRRHREKHRERILLIEAEQARMRRKNNPEAQRKRNLAFKARLQALREEEAGRPKPGLCELCGELHRHIVFDHCHETDRFRGWLCDRCNKVLGLVYDSPSLLRKLADYLDR